MKTVSFVVPDTPPLAQAASVALAVARFTKCNSWPELAAKVATGDAATLRLLAQLDVPTEISALISAHEPVLAQLTVRPLLAVAVCPTCQRWTLTAGPVPTRCKTTLRCEGKPVKASIANRTKDADPAAG